MRIPEIFLSPTKRIVAANTMAQIIGKAISALSMVVITLIIANRLGASGYGDYVKITTYIALFYLVADFGMNAIFLQRADDPASYPTLWYIRTVGSVTLMILALGIMLILPGAEGAGYTPAVKLGILLFSPTILLQAWITTANAVFQKHLRYELASWAILAGTLCSVALIIVFYFFSPQMTGMLYAIEALLVGSVVTSIVALFFANRLGKPFLWQLSPSRVRALVIPSIPLAATLLLNLVYFRADSIIITLTRATAEVGIYGLAYKVFETVIVFPTFFMNAVYSYMVRDPQKLKRIFSQSVLFLFFLSIVGLLVVWFLAPLLTYIKSDFVLSIGALRVLALGLPFFFTTSATMWALVALKKQKTLMTIYGISMAINIFGNILFIPTYGYIAAAWMTVAGEGLVLLFSLLALRNVLREDSRGKERI